MTDRAPGTMGPQWIADQISRANPDVNPAARITKPAAPREGWVAVMHPSARDCKVAHPGREPVFVRVVEDGE